MANPFDPVENLTLADRVYSELSRAIMMGEFRPGDKLTIRSLATMFGTSAQPVREAVNRLSAGQALTTHANRSIMLPKLSHDRVRELWAVRVFIEGEAAAQAAANATNEEKQEIEEANRNLLGSIAERDIKQIVRKNHEFHFSVYRASHNNVLCSVIESLWLQSGPYLAFLYGANKTVGDQINSSTKEWHDQALSSVKAQDSEGARRAIGSDIKSAMIVYTDAVARTEKAGQGEREAASL